MVQTPCLLPDFPTDLLPEILSKLPVKSLLRFCSVSKTWRHMIHEPKFIKSYKNRPKSQIQMIYKDLMDQDDVEFRMRCSKTFGVNYDHETLRAIDYYPTEFLTRPIRNLQAPSRVIDCVEGLFLVESPTRQQTHTHLLLWNPSIRRFRVLPRIPKGKRTMGVGFGFDPWIQDYKHVRIACNMDDEPLPNVKDSVMIYTMGTDSWKKIPFKTKDDKLCFFNPPYRINSFRFEINAKSCFRGAVYFIVLTKDPREIYNCRLVSFDMRTEEWSSVDLPEVNDIIFWQLKCTSDGSRLALVTFKEDQGSIWWAQGDIGDITWSKHYTFSVANPWTVLDIDLESSRRGEFFIMSFDAMALYDIDLVRLFDGESREENTLLKETKGIVHGSPYIESLALLKG